VTVVVVATAFPAPGRADDVRAALLRAVPRVHAEDGCELYALHESEDRLVLVEKWTSADALATYAAAPALAELRAELDGIITGELDIQLLSPVPAGTPAQGAL
jgi:quinol monooxygenase YgiN